MIEDKKQENVSIPYFQDRKGGLIAFGVLQIILGSFCFLMVPLMLIGMLALSVSGRPDAVPVNPQVMVQGVFFYLLLAVWFVWMGIGSIKARRWARALVLVSSWLWFVFGVMGFIFWIIFMPNMYSQMAVNGQMPSNVITITKIVTIIFMIVFYIVVPGIAILFYGSKNVKATCESRNPVPSWTDKCPLPVLGLSFLYAIGVISVIPMASYNFVMPFFGSLLSGAAGALAIFCVVLILGYLAFGTYKLHMKAWWAAVLLMLLGTISTIMTFSKISLLEFYQKMNFPEQQLKLIQQMGITRNSNIIWQSVFWTVIFFGYLLYVRKFFVKNSK
ncbi:MAG: hypothetical protein PHW62_01480 [Candidatus Ratteibacteria bacterium]|nr:hypothetical protein [Candidatus Ratteibacteria bacterium]